MAFPGPWVQPPDEQIASTFLSRRLRATTALVPVMEGLTESFAQMEGWWLTGATPPWPSVSGSWSVTFPSLLSTHEYPDWNLPFRVLDQWLPVSADTTLDRFTHRGDWLADAGGGTVRQHAPLLGAFQTDVPSPVPDVPPPGAVGVEVEHTDVVLSRVARVAVRAVGAWPLTVQVAVPPSSAWSRVGPPRNAIPGNVGLSDYGDPAVWVSPQMTAAEQSTWPCEVVTVVDANAVVVDIELDLGEDFAAVAVSPTSWAAAVPPPVDTAVEILSVRVLTTVRPRRYRWLYDTPQGTGMWRLRQRQSLVGSDGWPLRQRQQGKHSGSWPLRQRQRGI
jgi:hypothetical protein